MRVWLITVGEPLPLPGRSPRLLRTGLLANELARRGHEVTWWTSRVDHQAKEFFPDSTQPLLLGENQVIRFLQGPLYRRNLSWQRLVNHRRIAADFGRQGANLASPDVILCSFPTIELSLAAVAYGAAHGVPVLLDVRDLWPDVLIARSPAPARALVRLALAPARRAAARALRDADGILGISRDYLHWALALAERSAGRFDDVIPLGHQRLAVTEATGRQAEIELMRHGVLFDKRLVWFVGSFTRSFDLTPLLKAASRLRERADIQFVLSGDGEGLAACRAAAAPLPNVVFTGWVNANQMARLGARSSIGVAAYATDALMGLPNKLFDYLSSGLPVLSSLQGECATLLREQECGVTYSNQIPDSCYQALLGLIDDDGRRARLAANAGRAYEERFAGPLAADRLISALERVAAA